MGVTGEDLLSGPIGMMDDRVGPLRYHLPTRSLRTASIIYRHTSLERYSQDGRTDGDFIKLTGFSEILLVVLQRIENPLKYWQPKRCNHFTEYLRNLISDDSSNKYQISTH